MDFIDWTLLLVSLAFGILVVAACLIQVGWVARSATHVVRRHLPRH